MRIENGPKHQPRIFYGWYIVAAHMLFHFYMSVVFVYGMSVFLSPITMQMGWTRAQFSMAAGLQRIEGSIASPVIGFVVDRFGPRKVILTGVLSILVGVILLSQIQSLPLFYGSYLLIALGMSATIGIPFSTPVAKWFRRKRGTAMGLMFVGATFSGLFLPLLVFGIDQLGWRTTLLFCSVGIVGIGLPAAWIVRSKPEDFGYLPDGDPQPAEGNNSLTANPISSVYGLTVSQAIRLRTFWVLTIIFGLISMGPSAMFLHQVPYFESIGFSAATASTTIATFTLLSGIGRVGTGWLMDKIDSRFVLAGLSILSVSAFILLTFTTEYWHTLIYSLLFGLSFGGSIPARPILTSEYFGTKAFGSITGLMQSLGVVGGFAAPVLMGLGFDSTGSYTTAILIIASIIAISIPLPIFLPKSHLLEIEIKP